MTLTGEQDFLDLIDEAFPNQGPGLVLGRGDDCAILSVTGELCLSTDLFLEDAHFRLAYFPPEDIGYKALAVNLSDVAAMGGIPLGFSLGLAGPPELGRDFYRRLLTGMAGLSRSTGCLLTGGDLSRAARLTLCLTIWGQAAGPDFLRRGRALAGDVLFVHAGGARSTAPLACLGLSRAGLTVLEAGLSQDKGLEAKDFPQAVAAHLRPEMRLDAAQALARTGLVTALMDLSDGLAADLPRFLLRPGQTQARALGADLDISPDLLHPELVALCGRTGADPTAEAFAGGEDYALLGAVSPGDWPSLRRAVPGLCALGRVSRAPGLRLNGSIPPDRGFDHFRPYFGPAL